MIQPATFGQVVRERRAYRVVDDFERELCDYTGAPFAVAVSSCTNALLLALKYERKRDARLDLIRLPRQTYLGVLQSVLAAGFGVEWDDAKSDWQEQGWYALEPLLISDCARDFAPDHYRFGHACLSFHAAKQLPLGRGGAILTNDEEAAEWFGAARMDGRFPGDSKPPLIGNTLHCPMAPDVAARGLDVLSRWNDQAYSPPQLPWTDYPDLSEWHP